MIVEVLPPGLLEPVSAKRTVSLAPKKPVVLFPTAAVRIGDGEFFTAVFGTPYRDQGEKPSRHGTVVKTVELFRAKPAGRDEVVRLASVMGRQVPLLHTPPKQLWPQAPQFVGSVVRFTHAFEQSVRLL